MDIRGELPFLSVNNVDIKQFLNTTIDNPKLCAEDYLIRCKNQDFACIKKIIENDFKDSQLYTNNISNIIFMIYLNEIYNGKLEELKFFRKTVENSDKKKLNSPDIVDKNKKKKDFDIILNKAFQPTGYLTNSSKLLTKQQVEDIIARIKEGQLKSQYSNSIFSSSSYLNLIKSLKEDQTIKTYFIIWYCYWKKRINDSNKNKKLINFGDKYQNVINNDKDELEIFQQAQKLAKPIGKVYDDYPSIFSYNQNNQNIDRNCMSQELDKIFYFRYLINFKNLEQKTTLKNLLKQKQSFYLKNVLDLIVSNKTQRQLSNKFLSIFKKKRNIYAWVANSPKYLVTLSEYRNNILYIKTIGHEISNGNSIKLNEYNNEKINLITSTIGKSLPFLTGTKEININCNKTIINIKKNKQNKIIITWLDKIYNLSHINNSYILEINNKTLAEYIDTKLNILNVEPQEVLMIFAIGYAIQYNMNNLFRL